jgi:anti-anti-sigma factor
MHTVIRVFSGEYDVTYKAKLRREFDSVCNEPGLILDMRGVSYVDSTFANELLRLHIRRLEKGIGEVSIVRNSFIVRRLFALLAFKRLFRLVETLEEVLPRDGSPVVIQSACRGDHSPFPGVPMHTTRTNKPLPAWDSVTQASRSAQTVGPPQ